MARLAVTPLRSGTPGATHTVSYAMTNGASGNNRKLVIVASNASRSNTVTLTYNGVSATRDLFSLGAVGLRGVAVFRLDDASLPTDTTAHDIVLTLDGSSDWGAFFVVEFDDVEQGVVTGVIGDIVTNTTPKTVVITPATAGAELYAALLVAENRTISNAPAGTALSSDPFGTSAPALTELRAITGPTPAAETTYTWDLSGAGSGGALVFEVESAASADTTPPNLSNASASATGSTTAAGSVDTDEGNGTLYRIASTINSAPSIAQIHAGQDGTGAAAAISGSQAVSTVGTQNVTFTGAAPATTHYVWYQQQDAATNDSAVLSGGSFTTASAVSESPTDSYTLADTTQDSITAVEARADSTTLGEDVGFRLGFDLDDDTLSLAEAVADQLAVAGSAADTLTLDDATTENVVVAVSLSDALTLSDDAVAGGVAESRADALAMADEVTVSVRATESVADSVVLSDTVGVRIAAVASVVDSYTLGDTQVTVLATSINVLDSLTMTDVLAVPMPFNVHPSNILSIQRASPRILTR